MSSMLNMDQLAAETGAPAAQNATTSMSNSNAPRDELPHANCTTEQQLPQQQQNTYHSEHQHQHQQQQQKQNKRQDIQQQHNAQQQQQKKRAKLKLKEEHKNTEQQYHRPIEVLGPNGRAIKQSNLTKKRSREELQETIRSATAVAAVAAAPTAPAAGAVGIAVKGIGTNASTTANQQQQGGPVPPRRKNPKLGRSVAINAPGVRRPKTAKRQESSLGLLTRRFLSIIKAAPNGHLDLNQVAETMGVQKRRIYDITNVLEGVGMIDKKSKNHIQFKGATSLGEACSAEDAAKIRTEVHDLQIEEDKLDRYIDFMHHRLQRTLFEQESLAYTTYEDLGRLPSFHDHTLIAVKAPPHSSLEVPDPDEGMDEGERRYQIFLKSSGGPMDVYLVNAEHHGSEQQQQEHSEQQQEANTSLLQQRQGNTSTQQGQQNSPLTKQPPASPAVRNDELPRVHSPLDASVHSDQGKTPGQTRLVESATPAPASTVPSPSMAGQMNTPAPNTESRHAPHSLAGKLTNARMSTNTRSFSAVAIPGALSGSAISGVSAIRKRRKQNDGAGINETQPGVEQRSGSSNSSVTGAAVEGDGVDNDEEFSHANGQTHAQMSRHQHLPDSVVKLSPMHVKDELEFWSMMDDSEGVTELFESAVTGDHELFDVNNQASLNMLRAVSPLHAVGKSFWGHSSSSSTKESPMPS